jgi:NADH-quinone oxidoreductase subunit F
LRVLVERVGGGTASQLAVKCIVPDDHAPVLPSGDLDVGLDFDAFAEAGTDLGAGAFTVYATDVCAVSLARSYADAAHAVACPDCSPCTRAIAGALADIERAATVEQLGVLHDALVAASDGTCCGVPLGVQRRVASLLRHFPPDLDAHLAAGGARCALRHDVDAPGGPIAPVVAIAPTGDAREPVSAGRAANPAGAGRRRWALT